MMENKYFIKRRENFANNLKDGSMAIIFAGEQLPKSADATYKFRANNNFYYLTNIRQDKTILLMRNVNGVIISEIFASEYSAFHAKWFGKVLTVDEIKEASGVETVLPLDKFELYLNNYIVNRGVNRVYLDFENEFSNRYNGSSFYDFLIGKYPYLTIKNCFNLIANLRTIKDKLEVENISKAIEITRLGIENIMRNCAVGKNEANAYADFMYVLNSNIDTDEAFPTIAASGFNATTLHYDCNCEALNDNELLLTDLGAAYRNYSSDITRTYPINGKFNDLQKQIYTIVLNANKKVIENCKAGVTLSQLNQVVIDYYQEALKEIGLIKENDEVSKYYMHGVSHSLGLDTHDVGLLRDQPLPVGSVITVEPGLYIEEYAIGVRIEDDVLITTEGCEVLSKNIIKEITDIEAFMAK
ncbi:MAG: aminopeptidase P family protein [Erysipelotrichaceae bacterium]